MCDEPFGDISLPSCFALKDEYSGDGIILVDLFSCSFYPELQRFAYTIPKPKTVM
jgi:hypothetical protein